MKKTLKNTLPYIILFFIVIIFLIIGTFYDYEISSSLSSLSKGSYFSYNFFAAFFEIFGEMPVYIFPSIAICIVVCFCLVKAKRLNRLCCLYALACVLVLTGLNFYAATRFIVASDPYFNLSSSLTGIYKYIFCLFFSLTFSLVWYLMTSALTKKCSDNELIALLMCSIIVIVTAIIAETITHSLKPVFNRTRYRFLYFLTENGFSTEGFEFTQWFVVSQKKELSQKLIDAGISSDAFRSFPSGHSTSAAMVFSITLLPSAVRKYDTKWGKISLFFLATALSLIVMFSRIVAGAHYLSDVCIGFSITFITFFVVRAIVLGQSSSRHNLGKIA